MERSLNKELKEIKKMISAISKIDMILGTTLSIVILFFNIYYGIAFFIGSIIAIINFSINALVINKSFSGMKGSSLLIQISYICRMAVIIGITLLFRNDYKALLFYMAGIIFHQVAMFIYTQLKVRKNKH